ncbi:MAG: MFS transporter [Rothia sp. (in: high G+C Gram-positive bacteria)]|uniref:MFS transporter n=1 Tax=Rothia sp. (in: high G+C Gram-positive bacteria) TaxID=1885016 RepID=UPI0026DF761A|nr:MFS transporter [Rothia sp. (in: high G+C Gram-positive bacteria)]MDO5750531.1 MFS transporter [Rothia sp. (in: high G+C Gram-positive bacteria)]
MNARTMLKNNKPLRQVTCAIGANQLSDSMSYITIPLMVVFMTGRPEDASILLAVVSILAMIVDIFAGTLVDRIKPTRALAISCAGQALFWALIAGCVAGNISSLWILGAILSAAAIISRFDYPSEQAIIARVVKTEDLGYAAGLGETRFSAANLLGGPIAGAIAALSIGLLAWAHSLINLIAWIVAPGGKDVQAARAALGQDSEVPAEEAVSFFEDLKIGFRYVFKDKVLVAIAFVACFANFGATGMPLSFIYYYNQEGIPGWQLGVFASLFGGGVLLGSFFVGKLTERFTLGTLGIIALGTMVLSYSASVISAQNFWATSAVLFIAGIPLPAFNSAIISYINASTPVEYVGRVHSAQGIPNMILTPVATLLAGFLYVAWGIENTALFYASFMVLAFVLMISQRGLRTLPKLADMGEGESEEQPEKEVAEVVEA